MRGALEGGKYHQCGHFIGKYLRQVISWEGAEPGDHKLWQCGAAHNPSNKCRTSSAEGCAAGKVVVSGL